MRRIILVVTVAAVVAAMMALAGPALASHDHYLVTPGTCVGDIAKSQTVKGEGEGGYHKYHENVHLGTPGTQAFANSNNPVDVYKVGIRGRCPLA